MEVNKALVVGFMYLALAFHFNRGYSGVTREQHVD